MKRRLPLTHLFAITAALVVLAAGVWFYTNANEPVEAVPPAGQLQDRQQAGTSTTPVAPGDVAPVSGGRGSGGEPAITTKAACEAAGGTWNECASPCAPDAEICIEMCVQKCEFPRKVPGKTPGP